MADSTRMPSASISSNAASMPSMLVPDMRPTYRVMRGLQASGVFTTRILRRALYAKPSVSGAQRASCYSYADRHEHQQRTHPATDGRAGARRAGSAAARRARKQAAQRPAAQDQGRLRSDRAGSASRAHGADQQDAA